MSFLESWRLLVSTLSPVHIGCGEDYDPTNYVIENNTLHEFDPSAAQEALTTRDQQELLRIVENPNNGKMLQEVQAFFYQHRQALMTIAKRRVPALPKLVEFYENRVGKTTHIEGDGFQLVNKLAIGRTFFNRVTGAPILPGSSLKGAIRTALLNGINNAKPLQGSENNSALQQRLFQYHKFEKDPMRLVQLADAFFLDEKGVGSELRFAVNRRRKIPKPGEKAEASLAEKAGLYQLLECIPAAHFRVFAGQLTVQSVDKIHDHENSLPVLPLRWNAQQIATACNHFYLPQLKIELEKMQEHGYLNADWVATIKHLLNNLLTEKIDKNQVFLLRVGRHSGAESVTLDGVRSIKVLLGKDSKTKKMHFKNLPTGTSWWLAANAIESETGMLPFGWLLVEMYPANSEPPDWPEMRNVLSDLPTEYKAWLERERQQVEIMLQRQADAAARQQAILAKVDATLEQKAIAELQRRFDEDRQAKRKEPGGRLADRLNELLKEGLLWPAAEREGLAQLAEAIYGYLGWGDGKKKQDRKAKIQKLREGEAS